MDSETPAPSSPGPLVSLVVLVALAAAGSALAWSLGFSSRGEDDAPPGHTITPLPSLGEVPPFAFTERSGRRVTREDLRGRIWIVDFIFTSCAGICPEMSIRMASVHEAVRKDPGTTCVSVTVDPEKDTLEALKAYADRWSASPDRWLFLRGTQEEAHALEYRGFKMGDETDPMLHAGRFVLVDREGRIRGWYDGTEDDGVRALLRDYRRLRDEKAP